MLTCVFTCQLAKHISMSPYVLTVDGKVNVCTYAYVHDLQIGGGATQDRVHSGGGGHNEGSDPPGERGRWEGRP